MGYFAGFDLGGSHARVLLADADGKTMLRREGGGISMKMVSVEDAVARFLPLVTGIMGECGVTPRECLGCCVAASGVDTPELAEKTRAVFVHLGFTAERLMVLNDCEVFVHQSDEPTVALTVGTGSIAVGHAPDHGVVRSGGWGRLLSDEGSGFDMGLRVLRLMGNHFDGRVDCPALHRLFCARSDLRRPADIDAFAVNNLLTKKAVADFAPLLLKAADEGDAAARAELNACVAAHVRLAVDTVTKLNLPHDAPVKVLMWGGILTGSPDVARCVAAGIRAAVPSAVIAQPDTDALSAAVQAARQCFQTRD